MAEVDHEAARRTAEWIASFSAPGDTLTLARAYLALSAASCPHVTGDMTKHCAEAESLGRQLRLAQEDVIRLTEERNRQRGRIAALEAVNEALMKGLSDAGERELRHG